MAILKHFGLQIAFAIFAFAIVFSILGVYDTHVLPLYMRLTFWTATMAVGIITSVLVTPFMVNKALKGKHPIVHIICGALIASVPVTLVLTIFNPTFNHNSPIYVWAIQFGYVLVISLIVGGIGYPSLAKLGAIGETTDIGQTQVSAFLKRLPRKFHDATLYGFSAEDHYVRVYTDRGEDLLLLRFADALRELSDADGLQVHRSWWVMKDGVSDIQTVEGKKILILKSETHAPVSRTYLKGVKQAFSV